MTKENDIALEFAKVIGFANPFIHEGENEVFNDKNAWTGTGEDIDILPDYQGEIKHFDRFCTDCVLEIATPWIESKNAMLVHLVPGLRDNDKVWICEIAIAYGGFCKGTEITLPQAIMQAVIEANKIVSKFINHS